MIIPHNSLLRATLSTRNLGPGPGWSYRLTQRAIEGDRNTSARAPTLRITSHAGVALADVPGFRAARQAARRVGLNEAPNLEEEEQPWKVADEDERL